MATKESRTFNTPIRTAGYGWLRTTNSLTTRAQTLQVTYKVVSGQISPAQVRQTTAGGLAHANGVILVPAGPVGSINKFEWGVFGLKFVTPAHTAATGNLTVNIGGGGAALSGIVAESAFIAAGANAIIELVPLAATVNTYTVNNTINLVATVTPTGTGNSPINWTVGYYEILKVVS